MQWAWGVPLRRRMSRGRVGTQPGTFCAPSPSNCAGNHRQTGALTVDYKTAAPCGRHQSADRFQSQVSPPLALLLCMPIPVYGELT